MLFLIFCPASRSLRATPPACVTEHRWCGCGLRSLALRPAPWNQHEKAFVSEHQHTGLHTAAGGAIRARRTPGPAAVRGPLDQMKRECDPARLFHKVPYFRFQLDGLINIKHGCRQELFELKAEMWDGSWEVAYTKAQHIWLHGERLGGQMPSEQEGTLHKGLE